MDEISLKSKQNIDNISSIILSYNTNYKKLVENMRLQWTKDFKGVKIFQLENLYGC